MSTRVEDSTVRNRRVVTTGKTNQQQRGLLENNTEALIDNPLSHLSPSQRDDHVRVSFARWGLPKYLLPLFLRAGIVAQNPDDYISTALTKEERRIFRKEKTATFWDQSKQLKVTIFACCLGAIVQGWNQTGSNAANLNWPTEFKLDLKNATSAGKPFDTWAYAGVNAAPFLSASLAGCWLSDPLNEFFYGRRGATFIAAIFSFASVIGAACTRNTGELLACRLLLGIGMGAKASVVPIYAAEVSPAKLRGSLVMNWQLFTAFGELLGFSANLALANIKGLAWRLQMASSFLPTIPLMAVIFCCPESPRFLMKKGIYRKAYKSLVSLRGSPIQAARDMIYLDAQIQATEAKLFSTRPLDEEVGDINRLETRDTIISHPRRDDASSIRSSEHEQSSEEESEDEDSEEEAPVTLRRRITGKTKSLKAILRSSRENEDPTTFQAQFKLTNYWQRIAQLVTVPRTRRASLAAFVVMISQQLCAINILAFYSSTIFRDSDSQTAKPSNSTDPIVPGLGPLWYSWGFGLTNFLFAFPAYYLIDLKGRRYLLLATFPLMAITLVATALSYNIPPGKTHIGVIYFFFILFTIFYSPGGGPVPFTYSSEIFPLVNREIGMSFAVFWNLLGAGLLLLFVPQITSSWGQMKLLGLFAGLCTLAFCLIFVFVPETTGKTLEEINYIFGVPTRKHASYQLFEVLPYAVDHYLIRHITRRERYPKPKPLYRWWRESSVAEPKVDEKLG